MFTKQSSETINITIDFSSTLGVAETITTISSTTITPSGALAVGSSAIAAGNQGVILNLTGGTTGSYYAIDIKVNTSSGQILVYNDHIFIQPAMSFSSWDSVMVIILRDIIGDMLLPYQYTNTSLKSILVTAAMMTNRELHFGTSYTIDMGNNTISPDPVGVPDHDFIGLVCLKAAIFIADGEYRNAARTAIVHRDGPAQIDTKGIAENLKNVAKAALEAYQKAVLDYQFGDGSLGRSIVSPYNAMVVLSRGLESNSK